MQVQKGALFYKGCVKTHQDGTGLFKIDIWTWIWITNITYYLMSDCFQVVLFILSLDKNKRWVYWFKTFVTINCHLLIASVNVVWCCQDAAVVNVFI